MNKREKEGVGGANENSEKVRNASKGPMLVSRTGDGPVTTAQLCLNCCRTQVLLLKPLNTLSQTRQKEPEKTRD
jgi:hypothetical protein